MLKLAVLLEKGTLRLARTCRSLVQEQEMSSESAKLVDYLLVEGSGAEQLNRMLEELGSSASTMEGVLTEIYESGVRWAANHPDLPKVLKERGKF